MSVPEFNLGSAVRLAGTIDLAVVLDNWSDFEAPQRRHDLGATTRVLSISTSNPHYHSWWGIPPLCLSRSPSVALSHLAIRRLWRL